MELVADLEGLLRDLEHEHADLALLVQGAESVALDADVDVLEKHGADTFGGVLHLRGAGGPDLLGNRVHDLDVAAMCRISLGCDVVDHR